MNREETMRRKISEAKKTIELFSSARIYRVPNHLRKLNKSAYTPHLFAIGPLHKKDPHLRTHMRDVKTYYAGCLLSRVNKGKEDSEIMKLLQKCMEKLGEKVVEAKKYYAEKLNLSDNELVEMMFVDGCFILEVLYNYYGPPKKSEEKEENKTTNGGDSGNFILKLLHRCYPKSNGGGSGNSDEEERETTNRGDSGNSKALSSNPQLKDPILDNVCTRNILKQDLLLLENQIPFFVLEDLFELTLAKIPSDQITENPKPSLTDYVSSYFGNILCPEGENSGSKKRTSCCSPCDCVFRICGSSKKSYHIEKKSEEAKHYDHILHFLHERYGPANEGENNQNSTPRKHTEKMSSELDVSASDLNFAGVKFVPGKEKNLFHVTFEESKGICWLIHRAKFEIPTLKIDDLTETILRNLIALEQCCPDPEETLHFTSYASFMDMLINTEKDVEVIKKAKVTRSYLGADKDVSDLFNNLSKEVVIGKFYFQDQYQRASKYSNYWWPNFRAFWARKYFASPWQFVAFGAGIIACIIGVTQFIRSFHK